MLFPEEMNEIEEGLYLGTQSAATDRSLLGKHNITHIVGVVNYACSWPIKNVLHINVTDSPDADLLSRLDECCEFITNCFKQRGRVLVHCAMGVSRSSTVVIAYLMKAQSLPYDVAFEKVSSRRKCAFPNVGFQHQLAIYWSMGCKIDKHHKAYRRFFFKRLTGLKGSGLEVREDFFADNGTEYIEEDPEKKSTNPEATSSSTKQPKNILFRCRMCRRMLFTGNSMIRHRKHENTVNFGFLERAYAMDVVSEGDVPQNELCTLDMFTVLPLKWMTLDTVKGKIHCPKCNSKLGHFDWCGKDCPCGAWVCPWFHVTSSNVDPCDLPKENGQCS